LPEIPFPVKVPPIGVPERVTGMPLEHNEDGNPLNETEGNPLTIIEILSIFEQELLSV